jgi:tyrosinase
MSGQGIKTSHQSNGMKPAGNGGGCIEKGPFKDMKVNLGPMAALGDTTPRTSPFLPSSFTFKLLLTCTIP